MPHWTEAPFSLRPKKPRLWLLKQANGPQTLAHGHKTKDLAFGLQTQAKCNKMLLPNLPCNLVNTVLN